MRTTDSSVTLPDGLRLNLRRCGKGASSLLLLHGLGDGGFVWGPVVRALDAWSALAVDLRGHGDSDWDPEGHYTVERHAADVVHALAAGNTDDIVVVGHSLGADVGIRVASAARDRVRGLVIVDGGPQLGSPACSFISDLFGRQPWTYESIESYVEELAARHSLGERDTLRNYAINALRRVSLSRFELKCDPRLRHSFQRPDSIVLWEALESLRCPVLLVRGALSAVLSRDNAMLVARRIASCNLVAVRRAGHAVPLENPEGLGAAIGAFLSSVAKTD